MGEMHLHSQAMVFEVSQSSRQEIKQVESKVVCECLPLEYITYWWLVESERD